MKLKCSGTQPCMRCDNQRKICKFPPEERMISVQESYLRQLEEGCSINHHSRRSGPIQESSVKEHSSDSHLETSALNPYASATGDAIDQSRPTGSSRQHTAGNDTTQLGPDGGNGLIFRHNPLADNDYTFAKAPDGRYFYMGPSSSWSFCRRVLALIGKHVPESNYLPDPWHLDGVAFKLHWTSLRSDEVPDTTNLPPLDYALFLFNTVKFYFGHLFYIIDEPSYLQHLQELYKDPATKATSSRLWYAQYLLILAFGKAFVVQSSSQEGPSGSQYASRAMALLPDLSGIYCEPLDSIRALALAALYFQSIDMRVAAFQHIGQALRVCIVQGIHRHMPEEVVGAQHSRLCNHVFWVVYMIDREFSALMGGPMSIRDEDITTELPCHHDHSLEALNMTLHIRLSRLMANILTSSSQRLFAFGLANSRAAVYGVGRDFEGSLIKNTQSILRQLAELSKEVTALLNTHFQGSINRASRMALRLILSYHHCVVLTTRPLVMCALHMHIERPDTQKFRSIPLTPAVASLIQSCVDSAQTVLRVLRVIGDEDLLGSSVAPLRKLELTQLEQLLTPLTPVYDPLMVPRQTDDPEDRAGGLATASEEPGWDFFDADMGVGISPTELLDLAAQLDADCWG
ncbi:fungal specific transcription factor domain-containing protein [Aspergillus fischeri NRRL 181]|uniref:Fungal specific transcription factor, putative n=1 Tax=Neosartorya fischeri (strain ATCC 1020 / DSM 3700 / CBS 544.65 / FGSC A1164 / JCM 1740 / NRRL 181 / WB 181) TaxID=331117 RepID=A1CVR1_NEOFI|nr:fungal specific transcription factor, putative [Aspergillus fischeri NRRL 181]EAW24713.1 fungal specific transcription factor, putative [Aspergillus fischeri NRRL 181]